MYVHFTWTKCYKVGLSYFWLTLVSSFVPNYIILSQVVAEKSLTEKKVYRQTDKQTNSQTNIITEKAKTIYPLYFLPGV